MDLANYASDVFYFAFQEAFSALDLHAFPLSVTRSTQRRFGHYQCNNAMKLTKTLSLPAPTIAKKVVEILIAQDKEKKRVEACEVAGPGFINLTFTTSFLSELAQQMLSAPKLCQKEPVPKKIIIDFSSPNIAKEMHVGHLRSTIIGDSLARLFEYFGNTVLRLNHVGDWGTSFGMLIAYLKRFKNAIENTNALSLEDLVSYYKAAKELFDTDLKFKTEARLEVVGLQQGETQARKLWENICEISRKAYQEIYLMLDIHLVERGESFYQVYLEERIKELEEQKIIINSDGAKCVFLEGFENREGAPLPFILQKSDGGYNYATTDLAALYHRVHDEQADRIIYVTDAGQATHFSMLFACAKKAGFLEARPVRLDHVPFGLVLGPNGKKFKTRSGDTEKLIDLLDKAILTSREILDVKNQDSKDPLTEKEIEQLAFTLGINAIKYADLASHRANDYLFSYERMLRFEGNTAAFLMYAYVRICGIKRKVSTPSLSEIRLIHSSEIDLGLHLVRFEETLNLIKEDLLPHRLCEYLFELSEKFNAFFRDCRVEGVREQNARLSLCELTAKVLREGMQILGLKVVEKM